MQSDTIAAAARSGLLWLGQAIAEAWPWPWLSQVRCGHGQSQAMVLMSEWASRRPCSYSIYYRMVGIVCGYKRYDEVRRIFPYSCMAKFSGQSRYDTMRYKIKRLSIRCDINIVCFKFKGARYDNTRSCWTRPCIR